MKTDSRTCPECAGGNLHETFTNSGGAYGPNLLPRLGGWLITAKLRVLLCADCGLTRFYAEPDALAKLPNAKDWKRL
jgi:hypothetical protein